MSVIGSAHISGLALAESNGLPLVGWKRLDVDLENADLINQKIAVKRVALDGLDATLSVNRQGEFNVLVLAEKLAKPAANEAQPAPANAKPLVWSLNEFALSNGLIRWKDESNLSPVAGSCVICRWSSASSIARWLSRLRSARPATRSISAIASGWKNAGQGHPC